MLSQNKHIFERCNVLQWHSAGYTGQGVKIGVIDSSNELYDYQKSYIKQPYPSAGSSMGGHLGCCCAVIHEVAPDAEIIALPANLDGYMYALQHDLDIVSASINSWAYDEVNAKFPKSNCIMFGAAGNNAGRETDPYPASYEWSVCVAGVEATTDNFYKTSSRNNKADCCGYTYVAVPTDAYMLGDKSSVYRFNGTSCATPWAAGLYALYRQKVGKRNWQQAKEFIHKNCIDYLEEGWDDWSGYGLFVLPDVEEVDMIIEMTIGSKIAYIDGKEVTLLRAPEEKDGTTLVPIRFVAEALGCNVNYDNKTKKITIIK